MCYSVSSTSSVETLSKKFNKKYGPETISPSYHYVNGFTFPKLHCITSQSHIQLFDWGLVPFWFKGNKKNIAAKTLNARIETIHEKSSFKHLVNRNHCILPINGFFEWNNTNNDKKTYYVYPKKGNLFLCGGLFDVWLDINSGNKVKSFTIITTEANTLMSEIHNDKKRMPFLLEEEQVNSWLNGKFPENHTFKSENMEAHIVDKLKVLRNENSPNTLQPFQDLDGAQKSLFD